MLDRNGNPIYDETKRNSSHFKASDELGIGRNAANLGRADTLNLILRGKLSPALLQLTACCFLALDATV